MSNSGKSAKPETMREWVRVVVRIYWLLKPSTISAVYHSWPSRRDDLILAEGGPIRW